MSKLEDDSLMPYGEHIGKAMIEVPAQYLIWLYDNDRCSESVKEYIEENRDALDEELNK